MEICEYELKGVPLSCLGNRDLENGTIEMQKRYYGKGSFSNY